MATTEQKQEVTDMRKYLQQICDDREGICVSGDKCPIYKFSEELSTKADIMLKEIKDYHKEKARYPSVNPSSVTNTKIRKRIDKYNEMDLINDELWVHAIKQNEIPVIKELYLILQRKKADELHKERFINSDYRSPDIGRKNCEFLNTNVYISTKIREIYNFYQSLSEPNPQSKLFDF